ncbi:MAG: serine/threonine-protein kinase PknK, partial [Deltaproteobacteria bacterium]|nr:serine/threonine-protein kinase PknK [Deltaproteobacteria bacterium]
MVPPATRFVFETPIALGPFELHQFLGRGGMGVVWQGVHTKQQVPVAVKVLPGNTSHHSLYLENFRDEVRKVAQFTHPGIVVVFDYGEMPATAAASSREQLAGGALADIALEAGSPYLVMELCDQGSLSQRVKLLTWGEIRGILLSLLDALAHAHARGVVHRDIKPDNILFTATGSSRPAVKLTDFGIALAHESVESATQPKIAGTLPFMAPEQFKDWRDQGPWTDLYAVGCVAYMLAAGKPPFIAQDPFGFAGQHMFKEPPALSLDPGVPPEFASWVLRLLEKAPRDRFRCAADAARALASLEVPIGSERSRYFHEMTTIFPAGGADSSLGDEPDLPEPGPPPTPVAAPSLRDPADPIEPELVPIPLSWKSTATAPMAMSLIGAGMGLYEWRAVPFVGRQRQRDHVWNALRETRTTGRARLVLLRGEAGYGKSRLSEWMAQRALEVGAAVTLLRVEHNPIPGPTNGLHYAVARQLRCLGLHLDDVRERVESTLAEFDVSDKYERRALTEFALAGGSPETRHGTPKERYLVFRRFLDLLCRERPVIL